MSDYYEGLDQTVQRPSREEKEERDDQRQFWSSVKRYAKNTTVPKEIQDDIKKRLLVMRDGFVFSFARFQDPEVAIPAVKRLIEISRESLNGVHVSMVAHRELDNSKWVDVPVPLAEVVELAKQALASIEYERGTKKTGI